MKTNRRNFIKAAFAAISSALLSACDIVRVKKEPAEEEPRCPLDLHVSYGQRERSETATYGIPPVAAAYPWWHSIDPIPALRASWPAIDKESWYLTEDEKREAFCDGLLDEMPPLRAAWPMAYDRDFEIEFGESVPVIQAPCLVEIDGHRYSIDGTGIWRESDDGLSWDKVDPDDTL